MFNKVVLAGYLGHDPKMFYTHKGAACARFSLATTKKRRGEDGQLTATTEWHRIVAWGKLGEICGQYLRKGSLVLLEGELQTQRYKDRDGIERSDTSIVMRNMQMLDRRRAYDDGGRQTYQQPGYARPAAPPYEGEPPVAAQAYEPSPAPTYQGGGVPASIEDEDVPF